MKRIFCITLCFSTLMFFVSCKSESRYLDLQTGNYVELEKDPATGLMVNRDTRQFPSIYVDTRTNDTIYGATGKVINGHVVKNGDGKYAYEDETKVKTDDDYKLKDDETGVKIKDDKDGDVKIKGEESKTKIDGKTGEKKTKKD